MTGCSVGGEYTGASIFVAEYSPDVVNADLWEATDFGSSPGLGRTGAGVVVSDLSDCERGISLSGAGVFRSFYRPAIGIIGLYLRPCAGGDASVSAFTWISWSRATAKVAGWPKVSFKDCHQTLA